MIRRLFVLLSAAVFACSGALADTRDVYTITDIPVDEAADSVIEAQQLAFSSARLAAARALIYKLTLPEDRDVAGGVFIDQALAEQWAAAVDVQEEVRGGGRYRGILSVVLNPRFVRPFLQQRGVAFVDTQAPLALLAPRAPETELLDWRAAWGEGDSLPLAPYVTALANYDGATEWLDLEEEAASVGAQRGVIATLSGGPGAYRVRLSVVTATTVQDLGVTAPEPDLESAVRAATRRLDTAWKRQAVVRSGEQTLVTAGVFYRSLPEWNTLRRALAESPLVAEFQVAALARDGALVSFAYSGELERLMRDLRQRGVQLDTDPAGWTLTSAVTAGR